MSPVNTKQLLYEFQNHTVFLRGIFEATILNTLRLGVNAIELLAWIPQGARISSGQKLEAG